MPQGGVQPCHPTGRLLSEQPLRPAGAHTEARPYDERDRQSPQPDCERGAGASPAKDGEPDPPRPCRNRPAEHRQAGSWANRTSAPAGAATASADTGLPAGAESDRTEPPTAAGGRKGPGRAKASRKSAGQAPSSRGPPGPPGRRGPPPARPASPSPARAGKTRDTARRYLPASRGALPRAQRTPPPAHPPPPQPAAAPPAASAPPLPSRSRKGRGQSPWRRGGLG